jgi:antitoxin component YwqK of YwqJK toxin-antitoxin module
MKTKYYLIAAGVFLLSVSCQETSKEYYKNGNVKSEVYIEEGKKEGVEKIYSEKGVLEEEVTYSNGIKSGITKDYFSNGQLYWEVNYVDGKYDGVYKEYSEKGILILEGEYKKGREDGLIKAYFENGKLKSITPYKKGITDGEFKEYYESGQLLMEATYENDKPIFYKKYNEKGDLINEYRKIQIIPLSDTIITTGEILKASIKVFGPKETMKVTAGLIDYIPRKPVDKLPEIKSINGEAIFEEKIMKKKGTYYLVAQVYAGEKPVSLLEWYLKIVVK